MRQTVGFLSLRPRRQQEVHKEKGHQAGLSHSCFKGRRYLRVSFLKEPGLGWFKGGPTQGVLGSPPSFFNTNALLQKLDSTVLTRRFWGSPFLAWFLTEHQEEASHFWWVLDFETNPVSPSAQLPQIMCRHAPSSCSPALAWSLQAASNWS